MSNSPRKLLILSVILLGQVTIGLAQKSVKEFVDKNSKEKIAKAVGVGQMPVIAGGFDDGHGRNPLITNNNQMPDTIGLITFYVYDLGSSSVQQAGNTVYRASAAVSEDGGNMLANDIYQRSISNLKEAFKKQGVVLLTTDEFLNTPEKREYYFKKFKPNVSNLGKFLSNIENSSSGIAVAATNYRPFDMSAAADVLRAESLGGELAEKMGLDGVLSVSFEIHTATKSAINMHGIKMALHGPNPVPKENKKYVAQNMGNGYYNGQIYGDAVFYFKEPVPVVVLKKSQFVSQHFEGTEVLLETMVDKMYSSMNEAIAKAAKKYGKG